MDLERERQRRSYRLCLVGFSIYALALVVASLYSIGSLLLFFNMQRASIGELLGIPTLEFQLDTFRAWSRIASAVILWSAWSDVSWKRRSGLLVMMATADVVLWFAQNGVTIGLISEPVHHEIFRQSLSMALGWAKFVLVASLASDFTDHVGIVNAEEFGKAARTTAATGGVIWFIFFLNRIDWSRSWPLVERQMTRDMFLLMLGYMVIAAICLVQTSLLTLLASRSAAQALREMQKQDQAFDPWQASASAFERDRR